MAAKWWWLDDQQTFQPYDDETNKQIESAYNSNVPSIKLNKGTYFGKYENQIYSVLFDRNCDPPQCQQRNAQTNSFRKLKREIKPPSKSLFNSTAQNQINHNLINLGLKQSVIDQSFKIFNSKYNENSPILNNLQQIINSIMDIIENNQLNAFKDDDEKKDQRPILQQRRIQDPYQADYDEGDYIEILNNNVWTPAEIIKTEKLNDNKCIGSNRAKMIYAEYQDTKTAQFKQIKLHGLKDKNKYRVLGSGFYSDLHSFNFDYADNNNRDNAKNAKHPAAYINRKCFKCQGSGRYSRKRRIKQSYDCKKCNASGTITFSCNKCNGNGIFKKARSMLHDKCQGQGCGQCNQTGRFPLNDWKCNSCNGSGKFVPKNNKCRTCNGSGKFIPNKNQNDNDDNNNKIQLKCNKCIGGFFLNRVVQFTPKRTGQYTAAHGQGNNKNVIRLYHATDEEGARGIKDLGIMFRGKSGSYGAGIYFASSPKAAERKARNSGYLVVADVYVGKSKVVQYVDPEMSFTKLNQEGYDSIRGKWSQTGEEYVVYNWDQVWVSIVVPFGDVDFNKLK